MKTKTLIMIFVLAGLLSCNNIFSDAFKLAGVPLNSAEEVFFIDADPDEGELCGTVTFVPAIDESDVNKYRLYWGSGPDNILKGTGCFYEVNKGLDVFYYNFDENTVPPEGAKYILCCTVKNTTPDFIFASVKIYDIVLRKVIPATVQRGMMAYKDSLYLSVYDSDNSEHDLYSYTGSWDNAEKIKDTVTILNVHTLESSWAIYNEKLYFSGQYGTLSSIIRTDGTESGTKDLYNYVVGYYNRFITVNNSQLYLADNWPSSSRINIYNADETSAGPVLNSEDAITDQYVVLRDKILFFSGTSGSDSGFEPYVFDGSKIEIIQDYYSGPGNSYYSAFSNLVTMGDYAYMNITDGSSYHVCRTDGTVGNLTAITPAGMYQISNLTLLNSQLVFTGKENSGSDFILWKSNGTSEGTEELEDSTGETVVVSGNLIKINNKIYGITTRNGKSAIFVTDGTEYGTSILTDIPDGVSLNILHIHYPYLICNGRGGIYGQELWLYNLEDNSSINRPQMFRDMVTGGDFFNDPGSNSDEGPNATEYNNRIYFIDIDNYLWEFYVK